MIPSPEASHPKSKITEIAYVLDRSGSMASLQEEAVSAFNEFLHEQTKVPGEARLTLVLFDDQYLAVHEALPLQYVPELTAATFVPRGSTALLDAIGRTIKELGERINRLPPKAQPAKVIVAVYTDGLENASTKYSSHHIADLIRLHRESKGWEFLFLAANQDAIATAASLHLDVALCANVSFTPKAMKSTGMAFSRKVRAARMKVSGTMDQQALNDDAAPMSSIMKEEEEKARE